MLEGVELAMPALARRQWDIKWPNDLMLDGGKAGGILIENSWRGSGWSSAIIGIGINVAGRPPYPNAMRLLKGPLNAAESHLQVDAIRAAILRRLMTGSPRWPHRGPAPVPRAPDGPGQGLLAADESKSGAH